MRNETDWDAEVIAPCGMNCALCLGYQRTEHKCPGCRGGDTGKMGSCLRCTISNCPAIKESSAGFCYECVRYPCRRLRQLDARYRLKYGMSMLGNLEFIRRDGMNAFVNNERVKWACSTCGGTLCVHRATCRHCGALKPAPR